MPPWPFVRWGMLLVLLVAALLRLVALPELPLGLHYDEAANLILTRQIADGERFPLFISAYTGKEVLFFYATAPWVGMTGGAAWGLRLGAAMLGILTVAATFAAFRALFAGREEGPTVALLAAAWVAVALPHVLLSRYGFRAISQPLLQALTLATLWRGMRTGAMRWLAPAGVFLGLTGYTYLAARLFPVPLLLAAIWLLAKAPAGRRMRLLVRLIIVFVVAAIVFAPLGIYFLRHPGVFTTRIDQVAATAWSEAWRGLWLCAQALVWPGRGDPYVRFNDPGRSVMSPLAAVLAVIGLISMIHARRRDAFDSAGRLLVVSGIVVMILPSALATGEITPSNLRMVGLFPFLGMLPAWGVWTLLRPLWRRVVGPLALGALLALGVVRTAALYVDWARSGALFRAADGEMVLAAQALDEQRSDATAIYIASEHYRHPTVAALSKRYASAKWLTGGATLVLPDEGAATYLIPESLVPPAPWPEVVTEAWTSAERAGPSGEVVLRVHQLTAEANAELRRALTASGSEPADFAHVVQVHDARPALSCRVAEPCPILALWEPLASYPTLQPVARLLHPRTGEWARVMAFHYPAEQWETGELVVDQLLLTPPLGMPPGADYEVGIGFYDPGAGTALPRLVDEQFAGMEARFPPTGAGIRVDPMLISSTSPTPETTDRGCSGVLTGTPVDVPGLSLLGWQLEPSREGKLLPGSRLDVRLCWFATEAAPSYDTVALRLEAMEEGVGRQQTLYKGDPAGGYHFRSWRRGEIVEDRYGLRLPRDLSAGDYRLILSVDGVEVTDLAALSLGEISRSFDVPRLAHTLNAGFTEDGAVKVRLLGYELEWVPSRASASGPSLSVVLAWQAVEELDEDYVVFVHVRDGETGEVIAQIDEMPQEGAHPTSLWVPGEVVTDAHVVTLPADAGSFALDVGLYLPETGVHLMVDGSKRLQLADLESRP
ncbi:MAG: hypothetical protein ACP5HG_07260 [Anaerolineae bacterium]